VRTPWCSCASRPGASTRRSNGRTETKTSSTFKYTIGQIGLNWKKPIQPSNIR
jgi:hypothetical protein